MASHAVSPFLYWFLSIIRPRTRVGIRPQTTANGLQRYVPHAGSARFPRGATRAAGALAARQTTGCTGMSGSPPGGTVAVVGGSTDAGVRSALAVQALFSLAGMLSAMLCM